MWERGGSVRRVALVAAVILLAVSGCSGHAAAPVAAPDRAETAPVVAAVDTVGTTAREGWRPPAPTPAPAPAAPAEPPARPAEPTPAPAPPAPPEPVAAPAVPERPAEPVPAPVPPAPPEPARVLVPRIGVDNALTPVGLHPDLSLVVPDEAALAGWYTGAPRPGETGPSVLVGHNSWGGARGVFHRLHELLPGDEVAVAHDDGSVVRFTVERVEQYPKAAFPSERVYGNTDRQEVRIITCGGPFDPAQGRYLDNVVVFAVRTG